VCVRVRVCAQVAGDIAGRLLRGERVTLPAVLAGGPTGDGGGAGDLLASLGMAPAASNSSVFGEGGNNRWWPHAWFLLAHR